MTLGTLTHLHSALVSNSRNMINNTSEEIHVKSFAQSLVHSKFSLDENLKNSVEFFDKRPLHLSKAPESPGRQQEWGRAVGVVFLGDVRRREQRRTLVPPKSS